MSPTQSDDGKGKGGLPGPRPTDLCGDAQDALPAVAASLAPTEGFDWERLVPGYWTQLRPTCRYWDALLNLALDHFSPEPGTHWCKVGPLRVWVANWPYSYGYSGNDTGEYLPLVRTRKRLRAAMWRTESAKLLSAIATHASGEAAQDGQLRAAKNV